MAELQEVVRRAVAFEREVAELFGSHDGSLTARAYNAHETLDRVSRLSFEQRDSLKQAVRCVENELFRASFVLAWTAVADLILELGVKARSQILEVRDRWKFDDRTTLSEGYGDHAIIQAMREAGVIPKGKMKSLHGLLHRRNECAHPSHYFPGANEALGYIDEVVGICEFLHKKVSGEDCAD